MAIDFSRFLRRYLPLIKTITIKLRYKSNKNKFTFVKKKFRNLVTMLLLYISGSWTILATPLYKIHIFWKNDEILSAIIFKNVSNLEKPN